MYLGLDLSMSSTGWACWNGESAQPRYGHWVLGSEFTSDGRVFVKLHERLAEQHMIMPFEVIFTEEAINAASLSGHTNIRTLRLASGLAAHVHSFATAYSLRPVMEFNIESWRPPFIGRMHSSDAKREARLARKEGDKRASARGTLKALTIARCKQLGLNPRKDDEADAIGILTHGLLVKGITPPWCADEVLQAVLEVA